MECVKDSVFNYNFDFESEVLDVKNYFDEYAKLLVPVEKCKEEKCKSNEQLGCGKFNCKNDEFCRNFLGITQDELNELKERTSINHLTCEGEIEPVTHEFHKKFNEESIKPKNKAVLKEAEDSLISVKKRLEVSESMKNEFPRTFLRYCNYQWCVVNEKQTRTKPQFNVFNFSTIVACVKVYYPFLSNRVKLLKVKLLQEIHILGDQTLADLKDKIICSLDYVGDRDVSNECFLKDVGVNITAKEEYPSSFIFIENTFYNDTRSLELIDLSKVIRDWASERHLGPFQSAKMETTKICNLKLKLGRPYVYQHQGNCEHIIVFSDIRFLESGDPVKDSYFPKTHCTGRLYGKHCMMCADAYARWLVVGNERLTHDKTYLCNKCFLSYNYINGIKIGKFEAYKYVDPVALL